MLPWLVAVAVGVVLGVVTGVVFWRVNARVNVYQHQLNKLENRLAAAGADWLASILEDAVVGDLVALRIKIREFIESNDVTEFFLDRIALPLAVYAAKSTAQDYPDKFERIKLAIAVAEGGVKNGKPVPSANAASA